MTRTNVTPAITAESILDSLIIGLVNGEPDAHDAWLALAHDAMDAAKDYDLADAITAAIESGREFDALTA